MSLPNLLSAEQIIPEMKATERWAAIVELIDLLVQWHDHGAIDSLRKIEQNQDVDPTVRDRARRAIDQLS